MKYSDHRFWRIYENITAVVGFGVLGFTSLGNWRRFFSGVHARLAASRRSIPLVDWMHRVDREGRHHQIPNNSRPSRSSVSKVVDVPKCEAPQVHDD